MKNLVYILTAVLTMSFATSCVSGPKEARKDNVTYWQHADRDEWYDGD